jgi:hypothetical protein
MTVSTAQTPRIDMDWMSPVISFECCSSERACEGQRAACALMRAPMEDATPMASSDTGMALCFCSCKSLFKDTVVARKQSAAGTNLPSASARAVVSGMAKS